MNVDHTTRGAPSPCVQCGRVMDAHSGPRVPEAGDATVCLYCGAVMIYADAALTLRAATPDEIAEVERDAPNALADARRMNRLYRQFLAERN